MNERILLVDDDYDIISAFHRNLRNHFKISTATSGAEALDIIKENPPFAVVVSDYSMPQMNGIDFLMNVKKVSPDTVRVILTGYANLDTTMEAVNKGNVYRFLTKPFQTDTLIKTLNDCIEQFRIITLEKQLLDKTLKGTIKILVDILAAINSKAFSKASNLRKISRTIAEKIEYPELWEVEIAALLSQIGCITIPQDIIDKVYSRKELNSIEEKIYYSHPSFARDLVKNIPRLEKIANDIAYQYRNFDGSNADEDTTAGEDIPLIARILRIAHDFDYFMNLGLRYDNILQRLIYDLQCYDPKIINKLSTGTFPFRNYIAKTVPFRKLRIGMMLADDIKDDRQFVLLSKGTEITDVMLLRLINHSKVRTIVEPIKVLELQSE